MKTRNIILLILAVCVAMVLFTLAVNPPRKAEASLASQAALMLPRLMLGATTTTAAVPAAVTPVQRLKGDLSFAEVTLVSDGSGDASVRVGFANEVTPGTFMRLYARTPGGPLQATNDFDVYVYEIISARSHMGSGDVMVVRDLLGSTCADLKNTGPNVIDIHDADGDEYWSIREWAIIGDNMGDSKSVYLQLYFEEK